MLEVLLWVLIILAVIFFGSAVIAGIIAGVKKGMNEIKDKDKDNKDNS